MSTKGICWKNTIFASLIVLLFCLFSAFAHATADQSTPSTAPKRPIRILTLDSGGIHGIVSTYSLMYLEKKSGKPITELFDLIVCVSTGAIQATMLTEPNANHQPRYSAAQVLNYYDHSIPTLLRSSWWWRISSAQGFLKPQLNSEEIYQTIQKQTQHLKLSDLMNHVIILTYDLKQARPLKLDNLQAQQNPAKNFMLADIIYSAITTPSKIAPRPINNLTQNKKYMLIDGAIINNDPATVALLMAADLYPDNPKYMLSLGNGKSTPLLNFDKIENWGLLAWARPLADILFNTRNNTTQKILDILYRHHFSQLNHYLRIDPTLNYAVDSSFTGTEKEIRILNQIGQKTAQQYQPQLDFFTLPASEMLAQASLAKAVK